MICLDKLEAKTDKSNGCWTYMGQKSKRYAELKINGIRSGIHRWSFLFYKGEIPENHHVDHICKNTKCWNPDHLQTLPHTQNCRQNWVAEQNAKKTHCKNGHEFTEENVYWNEGHRRCKICRAAAKRQARL